MLKWVAHFLSRYAYAWLWLTAHCITEASDLNDILHARLWLTSHCFTEANDLNDILRARLWLTWHCFRAANDPNDMHFAAVDTDQAASCFEDVK